MKYLKNKIYLKQKIIIQDVMSIQYPKKFCKKIICGTTIGGGLSVLSPAS